MKIRQKLNIALFIALTITLIIYAAVNTTIRQHNLAAEMTESANSTKNRLAITLSSPLWNFNLEAAKNVAKSELGTNSLQSLDVYDSEDKHLFSVSLNNATGQITENKAQQNNYLTLEQTIIFTINGDEFKAGKIQLNFNDDKLTHALQNDIYSSIIQVILLVMVILLLMRFLINRIILIPLDDMKQRVFDIAHGNGDLTKRIKIKSHDELGELATGVNQFIDNVHQIIKELDELAQNLDQTTKTGNLTTTQLNKYVQTFNDEVHQIALSMNEISQTSKDVSNQTNQLASVLQQTNDMSDHGIEQINNANKMTTQLADSLKKSSESMNQLNQQSQKIGTVITVIESIAEQTNLLALNAAIEAARAGEHGRGFAVVSDEVRSLAQKTQRSISEIVTIIDSLQEMAKTTVSEINTSLSFAEKNVETVGLAGTSFSQISESVRQNLSHSNMIATATEEQTQTLLMIDKNVVQILATNDDTQKISIKNAHLNEEVVNSTIKVANLIKKFKI